MHYKVFVFHFDEKKSHLAFLHVWKTFFPSTISFLRATEEFIPVKLHCSICGQIKDIASSNPKSTDSMFRAADHVHCIYRARFARHVSKTYDIAFIVQALVLIYSGRTSFFDQQCLFRLLKSRRL